MPRRLVHLPGMRLLPERLHAARVPMEDRQEAAAGRQRTAKRHLRVLRLRDNYKFKFKNK